MLDPYFTRMPWVGLGVYLLMGANVDRVASPHEACFLPADLERAVQASRNVEQRLVTEKKLIFSPKVFAETPSFLAPTSVFYSSAALWFLFWLFRKKGHSRWPTAFYLMILGLLGSFILGLSFWTRLWVLHQNYNLLWLIPLHFPAGLWLLLSKPRPVFFIMRWYLWFALVAASAFVCFSGLLPQKFNPAVFPLAIIVAWRCALELFPIRGACIAGKSPSS
jgi:hypothetical protein